MISISTIPGTLEIDHDRGVIYFHVDTSLIKEMKLVTLLRICSLPKPIPKDTFLDVSHDGVCSWGNSKEDWK